MVRKITIILLLLTSSWGLSLYAQDIHFSLFNLNPLTLNPANTGMMDGDWRLANSYRTQWRAIGDPLNTFGASYDQQLYALPYNLSAGVVFTSDKSGGIELTENRILLSAGIKRYFGKHILSGGLQVGLGSKELNISGITFPEQYSREIGKFNALLPNGETNLQWNKIYPDVNIGGLFKYSFSRGSWTTGASVFHVNAPDDSFYGLGDRLMPRLVWHGETDYAFNERFFIRPSFVWMTLSKAQSLVVNATGGIQVKDNPLNIERFWTGVGVRTGVNRNGDAFIPFAGLDFKQLRIGVAYDINFSGLVQATNRRGALEINLMYIAPSTMINKVTIPCERF